MELTTTRATTPHANTYESPHTFRFTWKESSLRIEGKVNLRVLDLPYSTESISVSTGYPEQLFYNSHNTKFNQRKNTSDIFGLVQPSAVHRLLTDRFQFQQPVRISNELRHHLQAIRMAAPGERISIDIEGIATTSWDVGSKRPSELEFSLDLWTFLASKTDVGNLDTASLANLLLAYFDQTHAPITLEHVPFEKDSILHAESVAERVLSIVERSPIPMFLKSESHSSRISVWRLKAESGGITIEHEDPRMIRFLEIEPLPAKTGARMAGGYDQAQRLRTSCERGSAKDLIARILTTDAQWILESEIPLIKNDGKIFEIRVILVGDGEGKLQILTSYGKQNKGSEPFLTTQEDFLPVEELLGSLPFSAPMKKELLNDIHRKATEAAERHHARSGSDLTPDDVAVDIGLVQERGWVMPALIEMNHAAFQFDGLKNLDPQGYALLKSRRQAATLNLLNSDR